MKKILVVLASIFLLISCGGNSAKKSDNTLYVFNWLEYIPAEIYFDFTKETGIKVVEDVFASNEEMYAKIKAGATGYDLLVPSQDYVEILKNDNMIQKIDKSKISTYKNIAPVALDKLSKIDPSHEYAIPFVMGSTAIIVNTKYVKNYPEDFSIFTRADLKGRMTLLNDMRQVMTSAL
ncbi:MAG: extracellular solute-binding protein, partial [Fusobacteriaceae bacterium]